MNDSCSLDAHVRNKDGEVVKSKLWDDLYHYTLDRKTAKKYYKVGTSEEFLSEVRDSPSFKTDKNGEITFKSLKDLAGLNIETERLLETLNKDIHEGDYNYIEALEKLEEFQINNPFSDKTMATMRSTADGKYHLSVVSTEVETTDKNGRKIKVSTAGLIKDALHETIRNYELEQRLINFLRSKGLSVTFLQNGKEGGRYSTYDASKTYDGLYALIEISNKGNVTDNLAEEAGHFAIGSLGDHPLVQRIENLLKDPEVLKRAIGEDAYNNSNLGDNPARETAGRLVGKALVKKIDGSSTAVTRLAGRIANLAKRIFYNFKGNEVKWQQAKAELIADKIAYGFANNSSDFSTEKAINIQETMNNAALSFNQKKYKDVLSIMQRTARQLKAISSSSTFTNQILAAFGRVAIAGHNLLTGQSVLSMDNNIFSDPIAVSGIMLGITEISDALIEGGLLQQLYEQVDLSNPAEFYSNIADNAKKLRQVRTFIRNASEIISTIKMALSPEGYAQLSTNTPLNNLVYIDSTGLQQTIDVNSTIALIQTVLTTYTSNLNAKEGLFFSKFLEDIYGSNYVHTSVGKLWKNIWDKKEGRQEEEVSIGRDVLGLLGDEVEDIDVIHYLIGSMANNPDLAGLLVDKAVKTASRIADNVTESYIDKLRVLNYRANLLGLKMEDLVERDEQGIPTGNIIMPEITRESNPDIYEALINDSYGRTYNFSYSKWERAREKFMNEEMESFKAQNPGWQNWSGFTRGLKWDQHYRGAYKDWNKKNSIRVTKKDATGKVISSFWIPNAKEEFRSDDWEKLKKKYPPKNGDSIDSWVTDWLDLKRELDKMLPPGSSRLYRLPLLRDSFTSQLKNELMDKTKNNSGAWGKIKAWGRTAYRRWAIDKFTLTSKDTDYGDLSQMKDESDTMFGTKLDYERERIAKLQVFGVNKLEDMKQLSTDLCRSLAAYASMATSYHAMNSIVDSLELGRNVLARRKVVGKKGIFSRKGVNFNSLDDTHANEALENGELSRSFKRYIKFLNSQVYGISQSTLGFNWHTKEGMKRILISKILSSISQVGGTLYLKGNIQGGMVNTITGFNNILKEGIVGLYFGMKAWTKAMGIYTKRMPLNWYQLGKAVKDDRVSLFANYFDAKGEGKGRQRNIKFNGRLETIWENMWYAPYSAGDHFMQIMPYLALAQEINIYNNDGTKDNLWESYVPEDNVMGSKSGVNYTSGKRLKYKGFCPQDNREISSDEAIDGLRLKETDNNIDTFNRWLIYYNNGLYADFLDPVVQSNQLTKFNQLKNTFYDMKEEEKYKTTSQAFRDMKQALKETLSYINNSNSSTSIFGNIAPDYSEEIKTLLKKEGIAEADFQNIATELQKQLYRMSWTKSDEITYSNKAREIDNRLHGLYDGPNQTVLQLNLLGKMVTSMKAWALGMLEYIYSSSHYSITLGHDVEGFSNTYAKMFAYGLAKFAKKDDFNAKQLAIATICPWSKATRNAMKKAGFSDAQYYNARRFTVAYGLIFLLSLLVGGFKLDKDDKDEDKDSILWGSLYYYALRALLDQQALLTPGEIYTQGSGLLNLIPAGASGIFDIGRFFYQLIGAQFADKDNSDFFYQRNDNKGDRYEEGDPKWWITFLRFLPYYKSWWGLYHPYLSADNYMFGRKMQSR